MTFAAERLLVGRYVVMMKVNRLATRGDHALGVARRDGHHNGVAGIAAALLRGGTSPGLLHAHAAAEDFLMEALWRQASRLSGNRNFAAIALTTTGLSWLCRGRIAAWLERGTYRLRLEKRCANIPLQSGDRVWLGAHEGSEVNVPAKSVETFSLAIAERLLRRRAVRQW